MARPAAPVVPDPETAKPHARTAPPVAARAAVVDDEEGARTIRRPGVAAQPAALPKTPKAAPGEEKRRGRLTLANATSGEEERTRSLAAFRRRNQRLMGRRQVEQKEKIARAVTVPVRLAPAPTVRAPPARARMVPVRVAASAVPASAPLAVVRRG